MQINFSDFTAKICHDGKICYINFPFTQFLLCIYFPAVRYNIIKAWDLNPRLWCRHNLYSKWIPSSQVVVVRWRLLWWQNLLGDIAWKNMGGMGSSRQDVARIIDCFSAACGLKLYDLPYSSPFAEPLLQYFLVKERMGRDLSYYYY